MNFKENVKAIDEEISEIIKGFHKRRVKLMVSGVIYGGEKDSDSEIAHLFQSNFRPPEMISLLECQKINIIEKLNRSKYPPVYPYMDESQSGKKEGS